MEARNIGGWLLDGKYWRNVVTGEYLPVIEGGGAKVDNQQAFWFRNDDGDETGATWKTTGSNMDVSLAAGLANRFRLRIVIEETAGGTLNLNGRLFYSHDGGAYTAVSTGSSVIRGHTSFNSGWTITDEDVTTQQMAYPGTFVAGRYADDGYAATTVSIDTEHTEEEFCLYLVAADVTGSSTIDLRVYDNLTALDNYNQTPRITVLEVAAPQTVTLNTLTLASSAEAITITPAANSVVTNELTLASTLEDIALPITIGLNELTLAGDLGDPRYTSVVFDGDKSLAISSSDASLDDIPDNYPFTAEMWVRQDVDATTTIISKGWPGIATDGWYFQLNSTFGLRSGIRKVVGSALSRSGLDDSPNGDGIWHHLVVYFDKDGDDKIYFAVDGNWINTYETQTPGTGTTYRSDSYAYLSLGGLETETEGGPDPGASPSSILDGTIAWVALWDNDVYNHETDFTPPDRGDPPTGSASGLIEAWRMQHEGDDLTALALVNSANDANLYRCDWESEGLLVRIILENVPLKPLTLTSSAEAITVVPSAVSITLNTLTLASSTEAITIDTVGPLSISLNELTLSSSTEAITITPSAIGVILNELTLTSSAEQLTVAPGIVSIVLDELTLSSSPESLTAITPGTVSITLNELTLTGSAEAISQPVTIILDTLTLASSPEAIAIALGSVSVQLNTLTLASTLEDLTAVTPGVVSITLNELILASSTGAITVTPAAVSISTNELTLASSLENLIAVTPGVVSISLNELTLASSTVSLSVVTSLIIALNELILASSPEAITVTTPVSITLDELTLASSAEAISITLGAVSVSLNTLTLASSLETITVVAGVATIVVDELTLASTIEALTVVPSAVSTTLDTLTLVSSLEALAISAPSTITTNTLTLASALQAISVVSGAASLGLSTLILASTLLDISIPIGAIGGLHGVSISDIILQDASISDSLLHDVGVSDQDGDI